MPRSCVSIKVVHLYEAHLPVANTEKSKAFYLNVVGLQFAHRDPTRDIVFLWAGTGRRSMVGLWGPSTTRGRDFHKCHLAFAMSLPELLAACGSLAEAGVRTENFAGEETTEPSVIGWMPSAQIYFCDPDGHSLEFIALFEGTPDPGFNGQLSAWRKRG
jgi:lactoylglutathione lyase